MTVGWDGRVGGGAKQLEDAAAARTHTAGGGGGIGGGGRGWEGRRGWARGQRARRHDSEFRLHDQRISGCRRPRSGAPSE